MALTAPGQSLTLAEGIALARQAIFDTDANNYAMTDAQWTVEANNVLQVWHEANSERPTRLAGTAAFGSIGAQTAAGVTATTPIAAGINVLEFKRLFYDGATTPVTAGSYVQGPELEIMSVSDVLALQASLGQGTPAYAAVERQSFVGNAFNDIGKWVLYLAPMPTAAVYVSAHARISTGLYGTNGTDVIDTTESESRLIWTIAAARVAERFGESEQLINSLWRTIPREMQAVLRVKDESEPAPKVRVKNG